MSMTPAELVELARDARLRLEKLQLREPAVRICAAGLKRMEQVLAQPPRVALMGEVNSGKTSVGGLLLGSTVLPASVVANTHVPVLMRYSDVTYLDAVSQKGHHRLTEDTFEDLPSGLQLKRIEIGLPIEHLKEFELLDTPGGYVPGAGMPDAQVFLWCTVATRAWTESERAHWSALPRRCWRRGWLLATHKDALSGPDDIDKVDQRLRRATAGRFRDVIFVNAAQARRNPYGGAPHLDPSIGALRQQVAQWAGEVSARRARKAERIVRHLARLTFHQLEPGALRPEADAILKAWQSDCAQLLARIDSPASASAAIRELLLRFTQAMSETRTGRGSSPRFAPQPEKRMRGKGASRSPAAHRYVALICADLTSLLRIKLAEWGLSDVAKLADYMAARSILVPLANLDAVFDDVGQKLAAASAVADAAPATPPALPPFSAGRASLLLR